MERSKLGGAGDRFGDYLCVDCANFPRAIKLPVQNSPDLTPKVKSLERREGGTFLDLVE